MRLVAVPPKRMALFKKNDGAFLKDIGKEAGVSATLDGESVAIEGEGGTEWMAEQVITAVCLGFEPKIAKKLLGDDFFLEIIELDRLYGRSKRKIERYEGRVIGTDGRMKKKLEELSGAWIAVGEERIAIIGRFDELRNLKEAIGKILEGSEHNTVLRLLQNKHRGL
ncbi:Uncharacterised protein [Candidatus Norongarragalina meridionalis]|nr:Uncharacterised protein [Candidatus Norongarragalina meridionalis]